MTWIDDLGVMQLAISGTLDQEAEFFHNCLGELLLLSEDATTAARAPPRQRMLSGSHPTLSRIQVDKCQLSGGTVWQPVIQ